MEDKNKNSVIKEALLEYEQILKTAKEKLAENNSKELNSLIEKYLKESETKNEPFDKAIKESTAVDGKVQESTSIQQPIGEVVKEEVQKPVEINMREASLSEVEAAYDNANPQDDFQVVRSADQQAANGVGNEFDLTSIQGEIDTMMQEVNKAEQMQQASQQQQSVSQSPAVSPLQNDPMAKMKEMYEGMGKFIKEMEDMNNNQAMMNEFHSKMSEMYGESYKAQMDEAKIGELFSMYKKVKGGNAGEPVNKMNESQPVAEVAAPVVAESAPVEEGHGVSLSHNKHAGQESQPRLDTGKGYAENKVRVALQNESIQKKMTGILKENLAANKQLNDVKKKLAEATEKLAKVDGLKKLNEDYKSALEKYRVQLKNMAVLNTNVSYANNLFVNESFALTTEDKKNIIDQLKKAGSITESEQTYKKLLNELTESKKQVKETIEEKISVIVENSSAKKLEESVDLATNDDHINKILKYSGIN